ETLEASLVFEIARFGQFTVMLMSFVVWVGLFVELTDAWFCTVPHVAVVVDDEMCTESDAVGARFTPFTPPQLRTPEPIAQVVGFPQPADGLSKLQESPPGSV